MSDKRETRMREMASKILDKKAIQAATTAIRTGYILLPYDLEEVDPESHEDVVDYFLNFQQKGDLPVLARDESVTMILKGNKVEGDMKNFLSRLEEEFDVTVTVDSDQLQVDLGADRKHLSENIARHLVHGYRQYS